MAGVKLTQHRIEHGAVVQRNFSVFCDDAGVALEGGAKRAQAFATGVDRTERLAQEQQGFKPFLHQMFCGGRRGLSVVQTDDIAGEVRNLAVNEYHR